MALITKAEVKTRLNITSTDYDDLIDAMIIDLTDWLPEYLNNNFTNLNLEYQASTISFDTLTISDSESKLVEEGFVDGMDIYVFGSQHNDGHYEIDEVAAGSMTMVSASFTTETAGTVSPTIYQVQWAKGLKSIVSNMIQYQIDQANGGGAKSEKIGDYSITYGDTVFAGSGVSAYPSNIIGSLTPYRKLGWL